MHPALARIAGHGPVRFDVFQAEALYGPAGFYESGGVAGRAGDFVTAVELGSEFARCVSLELDDLWVKAGRPSPFVVVEGGAGVGSLCAEVFALGGACVDSLRWVMVERSARQRDTAMRRLGADVFPDVEQLPVAAAEDLRRMRLRQPAHVVIANELLDNLPVRIVRRGTMWQELYVDVADGVAQRVWQQLDPAAVRRADRHAAGTEIGATIPLVDHAVQWVVRALDVLSPGGSMVLFDYGATTSELAERGIDGWLRTYAGHRRGDDPLDGVGERDITVDVPFDQLPGGPTLETMATWMLDRELGDRRGVAAATVAAVTVDAAGLDARQTLAEFDALLDPAGIGGFTVATWRRT